MATGGYPPYAPFPSAPHPEMYGSTGAPGAPAPPPTAQHQPPNPNEKGALMPPAGAAGYQPGAPPAGAAGYQPGAPPAGAAGYQPGAPPAGAAGYQPGAPPAGAAGIPPGSEQPPAPSAPPVEKMDQVGGYEAVTFNEAALPPPSYEDAMRGPPPERSQVSNIPSITDDQARDALLSYVAENCCFGKSAAERMVIRDIRSSSAFHYTLESFMEKRETSWAYEPFTGQVIDGPENGHAPAPWDIPVSYPRKFHNTSLRLEVPHTASVKPCHTCLALGRIRCNNCYGDGRVMCFHCGGRGYNIHHHHEPHHDQHGHHGRHGHHGHHGHREHHETCVWCSGSGRKRCDRCMGNGQITCTTCTGRCQLKCYIRLTVKWTNHVGEHIVERTALPDQLIKGVTGQVAFDEELPRVWPINHFPDQGINVASKQIVEQHATNFRLEKILLQRHRVRIVPVAEVTACHKDKQFQFHVYGFENKVHAPDYPQTCCWGCTIL